MTDKDKLQYIEVLLALSGYEEKEKENKISHEISHWERRSSVNTTVIADE